MPSRDQPKVVVTLSAPGAGGSSGGEAQKDIYLVSCERSLGGSMTDHAVLRVNLGTNTLPALSNFTLGYTLQFQGRVARVDVVNAGQTKHIHYGIVEHESLTIDQNSQSFHLVSKLGPKMFGEPIYGQRQLNLFNAAALHEQSQPVISNRITFNPIVQGVCRGNMRSDGDPSYGRSLFVDIESIRSEKAINYQNLPGAWLQAVIGVSSTNPPLSIAYWDLANAVRYLCVEANKNQTYINNPTLSELKSFFGTTQSQNTILRNHEIPQGSYLPEALDSLLTPYGYTWYVNLDDQPKIQIVKINDGRSKVIQLQPEGTTFNQLSTNAESINLTCASDDKVTALRVVGSRKQVEATFELMPAWPSTQDSLDEELLYTDTPEWAENVEYHRVWRDWVLNEGGDYNGQRDGRSQPADLSVLLKYAQDEQANPDTKSVQVKRRRFLPTLTLGEDGKPIGKINGVTVEYFRSDYEGARWVEISPETDPTWACRVLDDECGISFVGALPPIEVLDQYQTGTSSFPRIRVTATVELDTPIEYTYDAQADPAKPKMTVLVDAPDRFHSRYLSGPTQDPLVKKSIYYDDVTAGTLTTTAIDSTTVINSFASIVGRTWARSLISGNARLEGLDQLIEYDLGDIIVKVQGREINFNSDPEIGTYYPQIVGIQYVAQDGQWTTLAIGSHRDTAAQIAESLGGVQRYSSPVHTKPDYR